MTILQTQDTEWNDILREKGIIPEISHEALVEMVDSAVEQQQNNHTLDELDLLLEDDTDGVLEQYARQRTAELKSLARLDVFGSLEEIAKTDYASQVTLASDNCFVVVYLYKQYLPICNLMNAILERLAHKHKHVKFLKIIADMCIENYPDKNVPTLLIYNKGDVKKQIIGATACGGNSTNSSFVEKLLVNAGVLDKSDEPESGFQMKRMEKNIDSREYYEQDEYE